MPPCSRWCIPTLGHNIWSITMTKLHFLKIKGSYTPGRRSRMGVSKQIDRDRAMIRGTKRKVRNLVVGKKFRPKVVTNSSVKSYLNILLQVSSVAPSEHMTCKTKTFQLRKVHHLSKVLNLSLRSLMVTAMFSFVKHLVKITNNHPGPPPTIPKQLQSIPAFTSSIIGAPS